MKRRCRVCLIVAGILAALAPARAEELRLGRDAGAPRSSKDSPAFPKGTWAVEVSGGYVQPVRFSLDKFYNANVGLGYFVLDNFSIGAQLEGYYDEQPSHTAVVGGAGFMLRLHLFAFDRFTLYLDGAGSVTMADKPVPEFGTHVNLTGKAGGGITYRLRDNVYLEAGARYFHLSNGNLHGRDQNPSYDGVQYYGGVMFTF